MKTQANTVGKKNFSQTMREGARVLGGKDVANYSLYFHSPTKDKQAGDHMVVVVPYVEIGRASTCQIQFGDEYPTVSRKHAAIRWDNSRVMVKQLSATNSTIIRRFPQNTVETLSMEGQETELTNGDQIQLSNDGPIMAFNATETKTSSMGFTQRLSLFSQQALRPYKTAVGALAAVLILTIAGSLWAINDGNQKIAAVSEELKQSELRAYETKIAADSLALIAMNLEKRADASDAEIVRARNNAAAARREAAAARKAVDDVKNGPTVITESQPGGVATTSTGAQTNVSGSGACSMPVDETTRFVTAAFKPSIYFIQVEEILINHPELGRQVVELTEDGRKKWSGTGFLTTDSRLVTARHVIQGWRFARECDEMATVSHLELTGGEVTVKYHAYSSNGDNFTFTNGEVRLSDADDIRTKEICPDLGEVKVSGMGNYDSDWAYVDLNNQKAGNIVFDRQLSACLKQQEQLHVVGYNYGMALQDGTVRGLDPIYSTCTVGQNRLDKGMINLTGVGYGSGCSGGPAFAMRGGKAYAVGIVSNSIGGTNGQLVAISNMR
jgi:hypothetical protein